MATVPSPEDAARHIVEIFLQHNCRAGMVLMLNSFIEPFNVAGWRSSHFNVGVKYAQQQGWVELAGDNKIRLTEAGYAIAGVDGDHRPNGTTDDLFGEYDALTADVARSRHQMFATNLQRWFMFLDSASPFAQIILQQFDAGLEFMPWYQRCLQTMKGMAGSAKLDWPSEPRKRLGLQIALFRAFAQGHINPADFAIHFLYRSNHFDDMVSDIISQLFTPMSSELRRYLFRTLTRPPSSGVPTIPASDRIVRLDHNSPEYREASDALAKVEQSINDANDYDDLEDKARRLAEVSAGRTLMRAPRINLNAITVLLGSVLLFLIAQFSGTIIGEVAKIAWKACAKLFGWDIGPE